MNNNLDNLIFKTTTFIKIGSINIPIPWLLIFLVFLSVVVVLYILRKQIKDAGQQERFVQFTTLNNFYLRTPTFKAFILLITLSYLLIPQVLSTSMYAKLFTLKQQKFDTSSFGDTLFIPVFASIKLLVIFFPLFLFLLWWSSRNYASNLPLRIWQPQRPYLSIFVFFTLGVTDLLLIYLSIESIFIFLPILGANFLALAYALLCVISLILHKKNK